MGAISKEVDMGAETITMVATNNPQETTAVAAALLTTQKTPMLIKVRHYTEQLSIKSNSTDPLSAEANKFLNKEGVPQAMDGAIDGGMDTEINKYRKDF